MTEQIAEFGALLRARRQSVGLSQQELAERAELSVRAISNLERGQTRWPHPHSVIRLADALRLRGPEREQFVAAAGRRLTSTAGGEPAPREDHPVPRQLPAPIRHFVGRVGELRALTALLDSTGH